MSFGTFLKLVEIKTKLASVFPFLIGILYVYYRYGTIKPLETLLFFVAMLLFDMTTTAINNYMDYKKAKSEEYRQTENIIGITKIPEWLVATTILTLLTTATVISLILVAYTDLLLLFIGMVCFFIGIFYTFGPIPFSRMPLGEILSGLTMGFGIVFLAVYVNTYDLGIANLIWEGRMVSLTFDFIAMIEIVLVSLPCVFTIANIMLANNICDLEYDIENERFTLPYYLGRRLSIWLFNALYIGSFVAIVVCVLLNLYPKLMLLSLFIIVPVFRHVAAFNKVQAKSKTFDVSVKNLVLIDGIITALLLVTILV